MEKGQGLKNFKDFKVTNEHRKFFGLEPILEAWDEVEIRKEY